MKDLNNHEDVTHRYLLYKIKSIVKLMRPKHYIKNFLIFLPLFFSGELNNINKIIVCILGFISFCLLASVVYIINDLKDIEADRLNPTKKNRPLASGKIKKNEAVILLVFLMIFMFLFNIISFKLNYITLNQFIISLGLECVYLVLNILYSCGLKNIPIVDIVILVSGFIIRMLYGAEITQIEISNWMYLTVMSGAFYMGLGKRRNEVIKQGDKARKVLKKYNKEFLDKFMYVCLVLSIVFYSLWTIDGQTIERVGSNYMIWTIPLLMIILMKYSLIIEGDSYGDPVDVLIKDRFLIVLVLLFVFSMISILYIL